MAELPPGLNPYLQYAQMDNTASQRVIEWMRGFKYKPGWEFSVRSVPGLVHIHINAYLENPYSSEEYNSETQSWRRPVTRVRFVQTLDPMVIERMDREAFMRGIIFNTIRSLEVHEILEWMRTDGDVVFDPHPPEKSGAGQMGPNYYREPRKIVLTES